MQLDSVSIENFRPFKKLTIKFNSKLNVIIGLNGAGKTAILDSIAFAFVPFITKLTENKWYSNVKKLNISETDLHIGANELQIKVFTSYTENRFFSWQIGKKGNPFKSLGYFDNLNELVQEIITDLEGNSFSNIPLITYYSTSRMIFDEIFKININKSRHEYSQFNTYNKSLISGLDNYNDFIIWFAEEEGYEDKMRLENDNNYRNPKLQVVRNAIELFLNGFENVLAIFSNLRIKKERNENNLKYRNHIVSSLVIKKNNIDFQLEQLSSGEKMILMLVVDIARRLSIANPSLENPLFGEGIILIDEIDLHLHPQWQRDIIPALTATFPNCQFIITTHSPQVLSRIKKESIIIIEDDIIVLNPPNTYGKDSNSILYEIFNTLERPKHIQEKFDRCYKLIESGKFDKAIEILTDLSKVLDDDDSEIIKIKSLLTFYEQ